MKTFSFLVAFVLLNSVSFGFHAAEGDDTNVNSVSASRTQAPLNLGTIFRDCYDSIVGKRDDYFRGKFKGNQEGIWIRHAGKLYFFSESEVGTDRQVLHVTFPDGKTSLFERSTDGILTNTFYGGGKNSRVITPKHVPMSNVSELAEMQRIVASEVVSKLKGYRKAVGKMEEINIKDLSDLKPNFGLENAEVDYATMEQWSHHIGHDDVDTLLSKIDGCVPALGEFSEGLKNERKLTESSRKSLASAQELAKKLAESNSRIKAEEQAKTKAIFNFKQGK